MPRDPNIPLFLWIAAAVLMHLMGRESADRAADAIGERMDVQRFAESVRRRVHSSARPMEIALLEAEPEEEEAIPEPPSTDTPVDQEALESETQANVNPEREKRADVAEKPVKDDPQVDDPASTDRSPKVEAKPEPAPVPEQMPAPELPTVTVPNRVAVVQHVEDPNQADNPNAQFIGDTANTVAEETRARITATDQNDPAPTPGTATQGPSAEAGNAATTDIAQSEDAPGVMDRAPDRQAAGSEVAASVEHRAGGKSEAVQEVAPNSKRGSESGEASGSISAPAEQRARAEREARLGAEAAEASPDAMRSEAGSDHARDPSEARQAALSRKARTRLPPPRRGRAGALDFLGLGGSGETTGGINLNLTASSAAAAVGQDQLGKERALDGERRRSHHRGSWRTPGLEKWRASLENYSSSVKPGNQTALNTARVPFATYLNQIHNRLHPVFADSFLASLDGLPGEHPLNKPDMRTNLEIVLDRDEGRIVKMGITRASGSTAFDVAALESVQNAAPFGRPPGVIVSPDGNVYLHWEFYRNPYYACSTYFARPFMLKPTQESAPPRIGPPRVPTFGPKEQPLPGRGDVGSVSPPSSQQKLGLAR